MDSQLKHLLIPETTSIKDAIKHLHNNHQRIILIVDGQKKLRGVVSDSDIRLAILNSVPFDKSVSEIMTATPVTATVDMNDESILSLMQTSGLHEIPILDREGHVVALKTISNVLKKDPPKIAIIMAGGMGTRLKPLTDDVPKALLTVGNKPILFILLDQLIQHGFTQIIVTLNYKRDQIKEALAKVTRYSKIVSCLEETLPLGTAGSLSLINPQPTTPIVVLNCDLLTHLDFSAMFFHHKENGNHITVAIKEEKHQVPFGIIQLDGQLVSSIEEKPSRSFFINAGIYVLEPSVLDDIPKGEQFTMVDLINICLKERKPVGSFPIFETWLDIGEHQSLMLANNLAKT